MERLVDTWMDGLKLINGIVDAWMDDGWME